MVLNLARRLPERFSRWSAAFTRRVRSAKRFGRPERASMRSALPRGFGGRSTSAAFALSGASAADHRAYVSALREPTDACRDPARIPIVIGTE